MFEQEITLFKSIQDELRSKNPEGGFAVINGDKLLGVWVNRSDALKEGIEEYGNISFLVKDINDDINHMINFTRNLTFSNAFSNI